LQLQCKGVGYSTQQLRVAMQIEHPMPRMERTWTSPRRTPLRAAQRLHETMKAETNLNCSVGIGSSRLIAKVSSAKAKPNGVLFVVPGEEARFLAPLDVRDIPGVGKVTEQNLNALGVRRVGDLAKFGDRELEKKFGKWGLALAGKSRGADAGGWFARRFSGEPGEGASQFSLTSQLPLTPTLSP
jgi:nucleotidyltransferase/DNA polymerase involved in DNA repair